MTFLPVLLDSNYGFQLVLKRYEKYWDNFISFSIFFFSFDFNEQFFKTFSDLFYTKFHIFVNLWNFSSIFYQNSSFFLIFLALGNTMLPIYLKLRKYLSCHWQNIFRPIYSFISMYVAMIFGSLKRDDLKFDLKLKLILTNKLSISKQL